MACTQHFVLLFNINTTINGICRLEVRFHQTSEHRFVQNCLFVCTTNNAGPVFVCTKSICRMRERKGEREYRHNRQEFIIFLYLKIILVIITCVVICAKNRFSTFASSNHFRFVSFHFSSFVCVCSFFFVHFHLLFFSSVTSSCWSIVLGSSTLDSVYVWVEREWAPIKRNNLLPESAE